MGLIVEYIVKILSTEDEMTVTTSHKILKDAYEWIKENNPTRTDIIEITVKEPIK